MKTAKEIGQELDAILKDYPASKKPPEGTPLVKRIEWLERQAFEMKMINERLKQILK